MARTSSISPVHIAHNRGPGSLADTRTSDSLRNPLSAVENARGGSELPSRNPAPMPRTSRSNSIGASCSFVPYAIAKPDDWEAAGYLHRPKRIIALQRIARRRRYDKGVKNGRNILRIKILRKMVSVGRSWRLSENVPNCPITNEVNSLAGVSRKTKRIEFGHSAAEKTKGWAGPGLWQL